MTIQLADLTIHINEALAAEKLEQLRDKLLAESGVVVATYDRSKPHLLVVEYDPGKNNSLQLLNVVKGEGVHAQLVGM